MGENKPDVDIIAEYYPGYEPEVTLVCQWWATRTLRRNLISQSDYFVNAFNDRKNVISMEEAEPEVMDHFQNYVEKTAGPEIPNITYEKYFKILKMTAIYELHEYYDKYSFYLEKFLAPGRLIEAVKIGMEYPTAKFVNDLIMILKEQYEIYKDVIYSLEPEQFLFCFSKFKFPASKDILTNLTRWMNEDLPNRLSLWPELVKHLNLRYFNEVKRYNYMYPFGIALENCFEMQKDLVEKLMLDQTNLFLARKNSIELYSKEDFGDIVYVDEFCTSKDCKMLKAFRYKDNIYAVLKESNKTNNDKMALYLSTGRNKERRSLGTFEDGFQIAMFGSCVFIVVPGMDMMNQKNEKATSIYEFDVNIKNRVLVHHVQMGFKPNVVVICKSFLYLLFYNQLCHYEKITRYNRQSGRLDNMEIQSQEPDGPAWEGVACHFDRLIIFRKKIDMNDSSSPENKELEVYIDEFPTWRIFRVPVPWNSVDLILDFHDEDVKDEEDANWPYVYVNFICDGRKVIYHFNPENKTFLKSKIVLQNPNKVKKRAPLTLFLDKVRDI